MMTEEKFIHAVKRNSQRLFVIAFSYLKNKHDAEDALQNTFLKLWKSKIEFNDDLGIDKWLTKVLVNDCKNFFNLSFRQNKSIEEVYDVSTFDKYFNVDLYNAVMSLNKKERLCVILFYYDDLTISDISKVTGIKESTVKSLLKRSRNKLKLKLGDEWIYEQ
ncbi:MAG: sigma-70 family RNA polymerase sigma factor [Eubacterium coprostanoligenes]|uniref:RNA polymerase sigma factor n=1 Tax=Eubacterium coprostanoligenes TaxID=290054 RepID=UPI00235374BD|nr:sigma-70 family RNA polymerase sigma factor [Eubacterium coprostanoligenes]MCI7264139.1 sigma-70 family RNA polymerase sigma factor [Eubacterium coprostanoligenes]